MYTVLSSSFLRRRDRLQSPQSQGMQSAQSRRSAAPAGTSHGMSQVGASRSRSGSPDRTGLAATSGPGVAVRGRRHNGRIAFEARPNPAADHNGGLTDSQTPNSFGTPCDGGRRSKSLCMARCDAGRPRSRTEPETACRALPCGQIHAHRFELISAATACAAHALRKATIRAVWCPREGSHEA